MQIAAFIFLPPWGATKKKMKQKMRKQKKQNYTQQSWDFLQQQQYLKTLYNIYTL